MRTPPQSVPYRAIGRYGKCVMVWAYSLDEAKRKAQLALDENEPRLERA